MKKIAIFASGNGSNFQAIVDAVEAKEVEASIQLLVCDKPGAYVIDRAAKHQIPVFVFSAKNYASKEAYEREIQQLLQQSEVELIVLAGYMRLIGEVLLQAYPAKIINVHPSLLPSFPGKDAIGQSLEAGVDKTGITIHYVDEGMDTGPIIAQQEIPIAKDETKESLQTKIHEIEHQLYVKTIQQLVSN